MRPPSTELLGSLGVLRRAPTAADRAPKEIREDETRPYVGAMRWVPLEIGGGVWVVPLFDISDRVVITEACIRTVPRRYRPRLRRLKRASKSIPREEGLDLLPYAADGESLGNATGSSWGVRYGQFVHIGGFGGDRMTTAVGLVPDGVASVRVRLVDEAPGRPDPPGTLEATVRDNVFGVRFDQPFEMTYDADVTWLDAAGAVVPRAR